MKIFASVILGATLLFSCPVFAQNQNNKDTVTHPEYVYVVPSGTVWHSTKNCSYLSRSKTIDKVPYKSVASMKPCSRCGHLKGQQGSTGKIKTPTPVPPKNNSSISGETYNGHKVYTGPKGGKYYINSNGNKIYIKR